MSRTGAEVEVIADVTDVREGVADERLRRRPEDDAQLVDLDGELVAVDGLADALQEAVEQAEIQRPARQRHGVGRPEAHVRHRRP